MGDRAAQEPQRTLLDVLDTCKAEFLLRKTCHGIKHVLKGIPVRLEVTNTKTPMLLMDDAKPKLELLPKVVSLRICPKELGVSTTGEYVDYHTVAGKRWMLLKLVAPILKDLRIREVVECGQRELSDDGTFIEVLEPLGLLGGYSMPNLTSLYIADMDIPSNVVRDLDSLIPQSSDGIYLESKLQELVLYYCIKPSRKRLILDSSRKLQLRDLLPNLVILDLEQCEIIIHNQENGIAEFRLPLLLRKCRMHKCVVARSYRGAPVSWYLGFDGLTDLQTLQLDLMPQLLLNHVPDTVKVLRMYAISNSLERAPYVVGGRRWKKRITASLHSLPTQVEDLYMEDSVFCALSTLPDTIKTLELYGDPYKAHLADLDSLGDAVSNLNEKLAGLVHLESLSLFRCLLPHVVVPANVKFFLSNSRESDSIELSEGIHTLMLESCELSELELPDSVRNLSLNGLKKLRKLVIPSGCRCLEIGFDTAFESVLRELHFKGEPIQTTSGTKYKLCSLRSFSVYGVRYFTGRIKYDGRSRILAHFETTSKGKQVFHSVDSDYRIIMQPGSAEVRYTPKDIFLGIPGNDENLYNKWTAALQEVRSTVKREIFLDVPGNDENLYKKWTAGPLKRMPFQNSI